jgi:hypothetical protein
MTKMISKNLYLAFANVLYMFFHVEMENLALPWSKFNTLRLQELALCPPFHANFLIGQIGQVALMQRLKHAGVRSLSMQNTAVMFVLQEKN